MFCRKDLRLLRLYIVSMLTVDFAAAAAAAAAAVAAANGAVDCSPPCRLRSRMCCTRLELPCESMLMIQACFVAVGSQCCFTMYLWF
jgi:hypothetical protein